MLGGAGEGALLVAEQLGLDQGRGQGGEIEREEALAEVLGEALLVRIERDEPRVADGAGHELLAGAGGPDDEGGDVVHALVERADSSAACRG